MDLFTAIETRRSVRKFRKDPIPEELLLRCVEGARLAPSLGQHAGVEFRRRQGPGGQRGDCGRTYSAEPGRQALLDAPVLVCCVAKRGLAGMKKGEAVTDKGDWFMFDCGIAMEHLALTAWSLGLGTVHLGAFDSRKVETVLHVPDGHNVVSMTPLGYPDEQPGAKPRKPLDEILFLDRFGKAYE